MYAGEQNAFRALPINFMSVLHRFYIRVKLFRNNWSISMVESKFRYRTPCSAFSLLRRSMTSFPIQSQTITESIEQFPATKKGWSQSKIYKLPGARQQRAPSFRLFTTWNPTAPSNVRCPDICSLSQKSAMRSVLITFCSLVYRSYILFLDNFIIFSPWAVLERDYCNWHIFLFR